MPNDQNDQVDEVEEKKLFSRIFGFCKEKGALAIAKIRENISPTYIGITTLVIVVFFTGYALRITLEGNPILSDDVESLYIEADFNLDSKKMKANRTVLLASSSESGKRYGAISPFSDEVARFEAYDLLVFQKRTRKVLNEDGEEEKDNFGYTVVHKSYDITFFSSTEDGENIVVDLGRVDGAFVFSKWLKLFKKIKEERTGEGGSDGDILLQPKLEDGTEEVLEEVEEVKAPVEQAEKPTQEAAKPSSKNDGIPGMPSIF